MQNETGQIPDFKFEKNLIIFWPAAAESQIRGALPVSLALAKSAGRSDRHIRGWAAQQPGQRGVAIGEVEDVGVVQLRLLLGIEGSEIQPVEARQGTEARIGAGGGAGRWPRRAGPRPRQRP